MAVVGIMAGAVWAAPIYEYSCVSLGGGLFGHTFTINNAGGVPLAWFVEMEWHGASGGEVLVQPGTLINQVAVFGVVVVDEEADAVLYDGIPGTSYDMALDTWIMDEFCNAFSGGTPIEGPNSYEVESGTEGGLVYVTAPHAYIVSDGDVGFSGLLYAGPVGPRPWLVSGTSPVPEPTCLVLLALGGLALLRRRSLRV